MAEGYPLWVGYAIELAIIVAKVLLIVVPLLIAVGTSDDIAGSAHGLAQIIPNSEVLDIPNRDHMRAVGDRVYKEGVLDFLARRP